MPLSWSGLLMFSANNLTMSGLRLSNLCPFWVTWDEAVVLLFYIWTFSSVCFRCFCWELVALDCRVFFTFGYLVLFQLVNLSVFVLVPSCFCYCGFNKIWESDILYAKDYFGYVRAWCFHMNFKISFYPAIHWNFDGGLHCNI